jgi:peptidoglycan/LPS O-acetylase OafA/YrhL
MNVNSSSTSNYVPSLDGLRALAVALVMAVHYKTKFGGGWIGVPLFFVLSGFLITRILLEAKESACGLGDFLRVFWVRRALRIFPLFLAFMFLGEFLWWATSVPVTWPVARPWLYTYMLNFGHMFNIVPISDVYTHFWSLAVEEQFYLLWPFVIWFTSRKLLRFSTIVLLIGAPVCRILLVEGGIYSADQLYFFTPTLLDSFAAGAAIALFDFQWIRNIRWWVLIGALLTIAAGMSANWYQGVRFVLWCMGYPYNMPAHLQYVWGYSFLNITAALLVLGCLRGELNFFANKVLVNVGKISYGIYIIHRPVFRVVEVVEPWIKLHFGRVATQLICMFLFLAASFILAKLSYHYFELPFLKLKARFSFGSHSNGFGIK